MQFSIIYQKHSTYHLIRGDFLIVSTSKSNYIKKHTHTHNIYHYHSKINAYFLFCLKSDIFVYYFHV